MYNEALSNMSNEDFDEVLGKFVAEVRKKMYFPLVFEVISRACFPLTPAAPFIVSSMLLLVSF